MWAKWTSSKKIRSCLLRREDYSNCVLGCERHFTIINSKTYCDVLNDLKAALHRKRPELKAERFILLHDNARPHCSVATMEIFTQFKWEILKHPTFSPDLTPSDFWLFPKLKKSLDGQRFTTDKDVKLAVNSFFRNQSPEFYAMGIERSIPRFNKFIDLWG